ncbi:MAG: molybdopterin-dependent oxidoreductase [Pirellulaceae bacterium]
MNAITQFLAEHRSITRRYFLQQGLCGAAALAAVRQVRGTETSPQLAEAVKQLEPYFTPADQFRDVSRGKPIPHTLSEEKRQAVGLTRETWRLEVIADRDNPTRLGRPMSREAGTALDFAALQVLGERYAVRFAKVMTCLNIGCPLGMGLWEGVPLREVIWRTQPREDLRRVFYYGYHNDDPQQMFRSSLPVGRVLEDPDDLPPVILCYKLNGQWLDPARGGPVRMVVPEAYGFKSIKWLTHVVLTNLPHANDTYAGGNNDVDSPLKTFAAAWLPDTIRVGAPLAVTGYAQVGQGGLSKVQVWVQRADAEWPADDKYYERAPWQDAAILPSPTDWGAIPDGRVPPGTLGFDEATGRPTRWPMRWTKVHWAVLLPPLPEGEYVLRSRTVDAKGHAQPMPRPFRKSGHAAIEALPFHVSS